MMNLTLLAFELPAIGVVLLTVAMLLPTWETPDAPASRKSALNPAAGLRKRPDLACDEAPNAAFRRLGHNAGAIKDDGELVPDAKHQTAG